MFIKIAFYDDNDEDDFDESIQQTGIKHKKKKITHISV